MNLPTALLAAASGYLLGSISFARLITRRFAPKEDIADLSVPVVGTDESAPVNIFGANATSMILGPRFGLLVALLDMLKVALPTLAFRLYDPGQAYFLVAAVAGLVGHNWPVYFRFRGGRGFSAIMGGFFVVDWVGALATPVLGLFLGMVIVGSVPVAYVAWLWLMIPWLWLRTRDPAHLAYAIAINLIFVVATIPEMRTFARYRREGKLDAYMQGLMESSPRWRGMKKIADRLKLRKNGQS
jgi:glycerol-3-phosphate acyltransferase PlsY